MWVRSVFSETVIVFTMFDRWSIDRVLFTLHAHVTNNILGLISRDCTTVYNFGLKVVGIQG